MIRKKKLILSCVLWIVSIGVYASDFSAVNDNGVEIYYNILSSTDKTCEVTSGGGSSYTGSVSIPSSVLLDGNTYAVTSIGGRAFGKCSGLTSVTIPNSVTEIGDYAFSSCSGLTSVTIPNSVTSIGSYAFASCSGLTSIIVEIITPLTIQEKTFTEFEKPTLYVPASALEAYKSHAQWGQFKNIQAIQGAGIPNNEIWYEANAKLAETTSTSSSGLHTNAFNATIKSHTFSNGKGIITFNAAVTSIGRYAFRDCSGLTSVTIPNSVTEIGDDAFIDCSGLTSVTIPNSVTSIGNYAFSSCSGLTSVTIPNSVTSIGEWAFRGCSGLTSVTIPNSVTSIGVWAFSGCSGLTSVTIPNSVTEIGNDAFYGCSGLTSVTIPNSVTSIGVWAFSGCSGLTSLTVESGNTVYDSRDNCNAIIETKSNTLIRGCKNTTIPNSVKSIGESAFEGCSGLTSVTIPNSVTSIGSYAFYGCSGLTSITVEIITPLTIQGKTFTEFEKPTLYVPASALEAYKSHAQWGQFKNIQTIQGAGIPNNEIWYEANAKLAETTSTYSSGLHTNAFNATIKSHTFSNGKGIITFNAAVTLIGKDAFHGCSGLTSVTIGNSVTSIEDFAFALCFGLTSVTIGNSVSSIEDLAFDNCSGLTSIKVESKNMIYDSRDNCNAIIETKSNTLILGCKKTIIPNSVTSIGHRAFFDCRGLTSVTIPNSVTKIDGSAFCGCGDLTSVKVESGNTVYDSRDNCNAIIETKSNTLILGCKTTIIPNSVTSIGNYAFSRNSGLTSVTIGKSVNSIGNYTFAFCSGLTSITVESGNTVYDSRDNCNAIIETKSNTLISGCKNTIIPNSVTSIGDYAFIQCSGLTSVTIPNSVTSIGSYAFEYCDLTSITVEAITPPVIEKYTFSYFEKPTLYVPASALEIYKAHELWGQFKNIQAIQGGDPSGTAHSWRVSNRTDITVDFASIEEADASSLVADGDTLYLERGTRLENQTFKKRLVIVGPGYKYDKAGQDASVGDLYAYGEGAEIIGLYVPGTISVNANNLIIRNCHLENVSGTGTSYENENCLIHSCFIDGVIEGAGADNTDAWELSNNIFAEGAITNLDNAVLDHNTFVVSSADWCLRDVTNSVVKNNILFHKRVNPLLDCSGNTYEKNIFSTDQKLDNNQWCETLGKIIECTGDPSKEAYYQTFKDGYAREYSTDGSDCGAFGGSDPYVKGGKTGEYKSRGGEEEILSGQCGVNEKNVIEWRIDKSTGTLYLEGSGRMVSYDNPKDVPWYTSAELIRHIVFDNSIIEIGAYAFSQLPNLNEAITLPGQLKAIGRGAFSGTPITSVTFEQPLDSIGYEAFLGTNLSTLYMNTVWLPYGFSSSSVRGGSGKLTVYVPKGQLERYRSHHWDSSWTDYYTLAESDYDCQWDEYYNDLEQLSGLLSDLSSLARTLSIGAGEKSMVSLFVRNSLLSDAEKEMRVADIVKRQEDIEEWGMESEADCKMTFEIVKYSRDNADWNRHLGQYIWGGKCVALLENLTGFRKHMEEYIKCFGVDASYKGIGGTCGTGGNEKNVTWSLDGINGILTVTGTGAMQKGLWDYWKSALIKHVILPDGITSIDKDAFVDFKVMESLTCSATAVPKLSNNVFSNTEYDTTGTLYVPSAALDLYRTATYWKDWANIRTLESDPDFPGREMAAGTLDEKATLDIEHDVYNSLGIFIQALASRGIAAESNISVASQTFSLIINSLSYTWIEQAAQALESTAKYFYMTSNGGAVFRLTFSDAFTQLHQGDMATVLATVQSLCSHIITSGITIYIDGNSYTYDGFQVEPNDLLSLKNLYERFGGTQWHSSYQWSFASNGRNAADFPGVTFTEPDKLGYSSVKAIHLGKVGLKGDVTDWVLYLPELVSLDLSVGELQGDLTGFVSHLTKLKSLDVSYNQLTGLTHLPSSVTSLYKEGQFMYNAEGTLNALQPVKVYISDRQTQNLPSILTYSLASNSCCPSTLYIMERDNTLAGDYYGTLVPESNTDNVYGTKWVSTPYIYTYGQEHDIYLRSSDHCLYPAKLVYESGDANMSGYTDVLDVQTTITDILNPAMVPLFNKSAADTYGDSRINVQDIVCMVNIVLRNQQPEQDDATKANARARTGNTVNALYTEGEGLFVTTDTPLGAIDVELTGVSSHEVGLMLNRRDFQLISLDTEGGSRHVLFSPTGKAIPVGTTQLLRLSTASAEPVYATLSSLDATLVNATIGLRPTGMDGLTSNLSITLRMQDGNLGVTASQTLSNVELRVMTLDGVDVYVQHLSTLQAGTTLFQTELPKGLYVTTLASADSHTVNVKLINK